MSRAANRQAALEAAIAFEQPLSKLTDALKGYEWDWDGPPLAHLTAVAVRSILARFQADALTAADVEGWAELLECREDLEHEGGQNGIVRDVHHVLANPYLEGDLTEALTNELMQRLELGD